MSKPRVIFISQLAVPGHIDEAVYATAPGGANEVHWMDLALDKAGVRM